MPISIVKTLFSLAALVAVSSPAASSDGGLRLLKPERLSSAPVLNTAYGRLPLYFEPNLGQFDPQVRYVTHGGGYTMFFTDSEAVMVLSRSSGEQAVVRMKLAGARPAAQWEGLEKQPGISNYFLGNDHSKWRTGVPNYGRAAARGVYKGIDLICYGNQSQLEYDLAVAPGADPSQVQLAWEGAESMKLNADGDLVIETRLGDVVQKRPRVYQETGGRRVEVASKYLLGGGNRVRFELARYDQQKRLLIDPLVLVYSTYLGGSGGYSSANAIAVDATGAAYVMGETSSADFPTESPYQAALRGSYNIFVTKLTPAGDALVYSTYLGGSGRDQSQGIAVDAKGSAYLAGYTTSPDFPTESPYQATLQTKSSGYTGFVTKLSPGGDALEYSTYLGGGGDDTANGIAVDSKGSAYIAGETSSTNFPTQSAYQGTLLGTYNAFVTKLTPAGNALVYSTYLGGSGVDGGNGIAVDGAGSAYVTGMTRSPNFPTQSALRSAYGGEWDAFVTKLTPAGNALVYSTYLGGSNYDRGNGIATDAAGAAYVVGYTSSTDFPTQSAYQTTLKGDDSDAVFVTKLTPAGNALVYSTYLGGSGGDDEGTGIALDASGSAYVTGYTNSNDFPTESAYQSTNANQGNYEAFVTRLSPVGNVLIYSTYLGGSTDKSWGAGIAVDGADAAYVVGYTASTDFPTKAPYQAALKGSYDGFVTKLSSGLRFVPVTPCRVADTRLAPGAFGGPGLAGGAPRSFLIPAGACNIPPTAQAYSLNVTAVPQGPLGYLTLWPTGLTQPTVSTLNAEEGDVAANAALVPAGANGAVSVFVSDASDVVLDINGYFESSGGPGSYSFYPATPCRIADTRNATGPLGGPSMEGQQHRDFPVPQSSCKLPATAEAYSLNVTVVPDGPLEYLTIWPEGQTQPYVSTLNSPQGAVLANAALVPAGTNGAISVFVTNTTDVVLDTNGYFAAPGGLNALSFYPVAPCRIADTRNAPGPFGGPGMTAKQTRSFAIPASGCNIPATAVAYSLNVTVVPNGPLGYLTAWPVGSTQPVVSTLNSPEAAVVANAAIVPAGTGGAIDIYVTDATQVILDINGYFAQ